MEHLHHFVCRRFWLEACAEYGPGIPFWKVCELAIEHGLPIGILEEIDLDTVSRYLKKQDLNARRRKRLPSHP